MRLRDVRRVIRNRVPSRGVESTMMTSIDAGWDDATRISPAPRPTVEMPRAQLEALVQATRLAHPRLVRR